MAKKKVKTKNVSSNEQEKIPSEGKTEAALKPVAEITKTPSQKKAALKGPKPSAASGKKSLKKNKGKASREKDVLEADVKDKKEDNKGVDLKGKSKGEQKDVKKVVENNIKKDNVKGMKDAKEKEKKTTDDELGGLIFMCNAKTRPDCYRYMVMGLPDGRKDLVMRVKPGLKLFLYDYDLKLLYGVYKATCAGGMRLERAAFGGSYPAQVRFKVDKDCRPLPISEFRNLLKETFDSRRNMFKVVLSVQQAKTLNGMFLRNPPHPKEQPIARPLQFPMVPFSPPAPPVPVQGPLLVPNMHAGDSRLPPPRETAPRDPMPLTEKDYRIYGLNNQRTAPARGPTPPVSIPSGPADFQYGRTDVYHSRPYDVPSIPDARTVPRQDLMYSTEATRASGMLPPDPYGRYESLGRLPEHGYRATERASAYESERLHSTYATSASALPDYNRRQPPHPGSQHDMESLPVSSRYAFAGPTLTSYR